VSLKTDCSTEARHAYRLCGLNTSSEMPLTGVATSLGSSANVDVEIQLPSGSSPVPTHENWAIFEHSVKRSLIGIEGVADFEVSKGQHIRVWPAPQTTQKDVEIFLCGPVWGALCHQRGLLPLHASAVSGKRGIVAFAGQPGAGKSTTAASMGLLGYELIADDILPISVAQDTAPGGWPYLRRLKLQRDVITELALTPTEVVSETLDNDKYFVIPKNIADDRWRCLDRIYLLEPSPTERRISIDRLSGADAVRVLVDQTYHFNFVVNSRGFLDHLKLCTLISKKAAIYRLRRPSCANAERELSSMLLEHLEHSV
jgi:hypothetical protein